VLTLALIDTGIATALFAVVWAICLRLRNYGFLDVTWTLSIGLLALVDGLAGPGDVTRRLVFTSVGLAWSLRLGLFVLARVVRHHPTEDKRYRSLRERWKTPFAFLCFFELQALIAVVFSLPFLGAAFAPGQLIEPLEWLGLSIAAAGILGEAAADQQSQTFKRRIGAEKKVLDAGLWRYSRHPNYFFEILSWAGFALAALPYPMGWAALLCPLLIAYFLLRVTGVPLTEKHSLETHGDAYRDYQRRTNAIIPWPPKVRAP
jgi:steroid 5-alpha reductase family enzyme